MTQPAGRAFRALRILPASAHYDHGDLPGSWRDLPVASFAESGTRIPTGFCIYRRRG